MSAQLPSVHDRHSLEKRECALAKKKVERKQRYRAQSPTKEGDTREAPGLRVLGPGLSVALIK